MGEKIKSCLRYFRGLENDLKKLDLSWKYIFCERDLRLTA